MVEGPGCKLKGERIKARVLNQSVISVSGSVVCAKPHKYNTTPISQQVETKFKHVPHFLELVGHTLADVQTLGKELFIFFENLAVCLRIHFLMAGTFQLNGRKLDPEGSVVSGDPSLVLELTNDSLAFFQSSCEIRSAAECVERIQRLCALDICGRDFNHKIALELIQKQRGRMICDVLLDQSILPGVGNIIKNEALFDSGIRPDIKIEELNKKQISLIVKMTRDFSMLFYKCRRESKPLEPHLKVYRKQNCKQCGSKIVTTRMGESSDRLTSFCINCQSSHSPSKGLAKRNSLLGWVFTTEESSPVDSSWSCEMCTFVNSGQKLSCEMCLTPRNKLNEKKVKAELSHVDEKSVHENRNVQTKFIPGDVRNDVGRQQKRPPADREGNSEKKRRKVSENGAFEEQKPSNTVIGSSQESLATNSVGYQLTCNKVKAPLCPQHKRLCIMKEVHKKGENLHRMFWSCPERRRCSYFKWADEQFPVCDGHGRRTVLRTVLKQGANNGRKFFACCLPKSQQCGFFQWADQY